MPHRQVAVANLSVRTLQLVVVGFPEGTYKKELFVLVCMILAVLLFIFVVVVVVVIVVVAVFVFVVVVVVVASSLLPLSCCRCLLCISLLPLPTTMCNSRCNIILSLSLSLRCRVVVVDVVVRRSGLLLSRYTIFPTFLGCAMPPKRMLCCVHISCKKQGRTTLEKKSSVKILNQTISTVLLLALLAVEKLVPIKSGVYGC